MPIQLDKILADIAEEKPLHPQSDAAKSKKDQDEAWIKVGKKNKLSAHEAKSIFKVLQKKYEQEKLKSSSTWKLFQQMEEICKKQEDVKLKLEEELHEQEDESMVEFLEVREEDDDYDGESDTQAKSMRSQNDSPQSSPEKESPNNVESKPELKVLNSNLMVSQAHTPVKPEYNQQKQSTAFSKALQNKGISLRKTNTNQSLKQTTLTKTTTRPSQGERSMLLPESIKRKLQHVETQREEATPAKKASIIQAQISNTPSQAQIPEVDIKKESIDELESLINPNGTPINVITIPSNNQTISNDLSNGMTTFKPNGFNAQDLDFQKDIIFDSNPTSSSAKSCQHGNATAEIINLGNFDNHLPPTFFKNLCNSNRHEALGLYVANVMNRVTGKTAAKLELNILKAIIEAQSDEMARL